VRDGWLGLLSFHDKLNRHTFQGTELYSFEAQYLLEVKDMCGFMKKIMKAIGLLVILLFAKKMHNHCCHSEKD
jgi:hypothetical protein